MTFAHFGRLLIVSVSALFPFIGFIITATEGKKLNKAAILSHKGTEARVRKMYLNVCF